MVSPRLSLEASISELTAVTDSLLLLAWSSLTFWNAWFLGRS